MTESQDTEPDDDLSFSRRDVLKTVGGASAISAFGAEKATAQPSNEFIVGTEHGKADVAKGKAESVKRELDFGRKIGRVVVGRWPEQALQGLKNNPHVRYVEENGTMQTGQQTLTYNVDRVDAEIAHVNGDTGSGVDLAILDTGIDTDHDDLPSLGTSHAFVDCSGSDCNEDWDDDESHGTHVAGIAAALDNTEDVVGVAPGATLHAIKVCDDSGSCPYDVLAAGIKKAADQGYDVANMSIWGGHCDCVHDAVEYADDKDVVLVAINGNGGPCTDCVSHPAAISEVIAVSSTDNGDNFSNFSSQGPETDIAAPGSGVLSTVPGGTGTKSGTSMAAPAVAGAAAQLIAAGTNPSDVRSELKNTAEDIGLSDNEQGAGLLDVANSLGHDSANDLLEVETSFADAIGYTEARLNGELTRLTGSDSAEVFFEYRQEGTGSWTKTPTKTLNGTGSFDSTVTGLDQDTSYEFRAGATVDESAEGWSSTEHGSVQAFDTENNPPPTASFTHVPTVPDPGKEVEFDGSGSDPGDLPGLPDSIVSYEWDFENDGTFDATGETVTHSYPDPGDVTVRLRVTDEFDQTDETTETLRVNEAPEAAFTHAPTLPNEEETVEFDATASKDPDGDVVEYEWDFDDGTTETTSDPVIEHSYEIGDYGEREVTLAVTDNDDATHEVTETIRVNAFPDADFDVVTDPPVRDEPVEFDASDSEDRDPEFDGEIESYVWDFGDGTTATATDPVIEHTYTTGGEKTVTLRAIDNDGASHDDLSVHEETFAVYVRVAIDIKPGNGPNSINPNSNGDIPVAVLHTSEFDPPSRLDPSSVHFGDPDDVGFDDSDEPEERGATPSHADGHIQDVDDDGALDSLFHFPTRDADFESDDVDGKLVGLTNDAEPVPVFGTDSVRIVGGGGP